MFEKQRFISRSEALAKPVVREARVSDIDRLVELEFETFDDVYKENPADPENVRSMIEARLGVAKELMIVGEVDGVVEGVMACQRTDKSADQIHSWEETTNYGTLVGTHVPDGKNFYIVNLAVSKKGSEHNLYNQLVAHMTGRFIEAQGEQAQFLSRIPQFSQWLGEQHINFDALSATDQDALAHEYVAATKIVDGKERTYDGVLYRYIQTGAQPVAIIRDGYIDPSSRNYEVLCVFGNPLPEKLRRSRIISHLAGRAIRYMSNFPVLVNKFL
jgi:hypothetical protein